MKKLFCILMIFVCLVGCSNEKAEYEGSYAILTKENHSSLVVVWVYPTEDFQFGENSVDTSNLDAYIEADFDNSGSGVVLNNLLGNLGFERKFLKIQPIDIGEANVKKIIRKKIPIYLDIADQHGVNYHVKLHYDKSIKE